MIKGIEMALDKQFEIPEIGEPTPKKVKSRPAGHQDGENPHNMPSAGETVQSSPSWIRQYFSSVANDYQERRRQKNALKRKGLIRKTGRALNVVFAITPIMTITHSLIVRPIYSAVGKVVAYREAYLYFKNRHKPTTQAEATPIKDNVVQLNIKSQDDQSTSKDAGQNGSKRMTRNEVLVASIMVETVLVGYAATALYLNQGVQMTITAKIAQFPLIGSVIVVPLLIVLQINAYLKGRNLTKASRSAEGIK